MVKRCVSGCKGLHEDICTKSPRCTYLNGKKKYCRLANTFKMSKTNCRVSRRMTKKNKVHVARERLQQFFLKIKKPASKSVRCPTTPSVSPEASPKASPKESPSVSPRVSPQESPQESPSVSPSVSPEESPSVSPEASPSVSPEESPSVSPASPDSLSVELTTLMEKPGKPYTRKKRRNRAKTQTRASMLYRGL